MDPGQRRERLGRNLQADRHDRRHGRLQLYWECRDGGVLNSSTGGTLLASLDPAGANTPLGAASQDAPTAWLAKQTLSGFTSGSHTLRLTYDHGCNAPKCGVTIDAFRV